MFAKRLIPRQQVIPCNRLSFVVFTLSPTTICQHGNAIRLLLSLSVNSRTILVIRFRNIIQVDIRLKFYIEGKIHTCEIMGCQHTAFFIIEVVIVRVIPIVTGVGQTVDTEEVRWILTKIIDTLSGLLGSIPGCVIFVTQPRWVQRISIYCGTGRTGDILAWIAISQASAHIQPLGQFGCDAGTEWITFIILAISITFIIQIR